MKDACFSTVCCIGLGPAGIGTVYTFSKSHLAQHTICLEAGVSLDNKNCHILQGGDCKSENPCQMITGIGGCALLSGGKMSGYPAGSGLVSVLGSADVTEEKLTDALQTLRDFLPVQETDVKIVPELAKERFRKLGFEYRYYPVFTFDQRDLTKAYKMILVKARSKGVRVFLNTEITDIKLEKDRFMLIGLRKNQEVKILTKYLILAVGRFGQKLLKSLSSRIETTHKEYHLDIGVRLEFPTDVYAHIDESHKDLKLLFDDARTFCVCKDGKVAPYRYGDMFLLEGYHSPIHKTGFTNLSIMIRVKPQWRGERFFDEIKRRVHRISGGKPVRQMLPEYLGSKSKSDFSASSVSFWQWGNVNKCFPTEISTRIRKAVHNFASRLLPEDQWWKVSVFAPEIDFRLRFPIESDFSVIPRLHLVGDCTGRFRGILQAFCSGVVCAENIIGSEHSDRK